MADTGALQFVTVDPARDAIKNLNKCVSVARSARFDSVPRINMLAWIVIPTCCDPFVAKLFVGSNYNVDMFVEDSVTQILASGVKQEAWNCYLSMTLNRLLLTTIMQLIVREYLVVKSFVIVFDPNAVTSVVTGAILMSPTAISFIVSSTLKCFVTVREEAVQSDVPYSRANKE